MITYKVEGLTELMAKFNASQWVPPGKIDAIVNQAAQEVVQTLKANYEAGGHKKTGNLINSIQAFQRKRGSQPFFTYYVGPKYGAGGNAAHLLEYGTEPRFRANVKEGGRTIGGRTFGQKASTGQVQAYGVIRRSVDQVRPQMIEFLKSKLFTMLMDEAKKNGFNTKAA